MKNLTSYYSKKNVLFKNINKILPAQLNTKKKVEIYTATSIDNKYYAIFILNSKSRFLKKNADELIELLEKLKILLEHNFKKKELLISSSICSKAKEYLKLNEWDVKIDFM